MVPLEGENMFKCLLVFLGLVFVLFQTTISSANNPARSVMKPLKNVSMVLDAHAQIISKNFRTNTNLSQICKAVVRERFRSLQRELSSECNNNTGQIILRLTTNALLPKLLRGMVFEVTPLYGRKMVPFTNREAQNKNRITNWSCRVSARKPNADYLRVGGHSINIFDAAVEEHSRSVPSDRRSKFMGLLRSCAGKVINTNFDNGSNTAENRSKLGSRKNSRNQKPRKTKQIKPKPKLPKIGLAKPQKPPKFGVPKFSANAGSFGGSPQCVSAVKTLQSKNMLGSAGTLIRNNCSVMYRKKWLKGRGTTNTNVCRPAWNALAKTKALRATKVLVTRNCPIIYAKGWRNPRKINLPEQSKTRKPKFPMTLAGLMNKPVCIRAAKGQYIVVERNQRIVNANRKKCGPWETFIIRKNAIYNTAWKTYLSCQPNGRLEGNRKKVGSWERIRVIPQKDGTFAFRCMAHGKKYLVAEGAGGKNMNANRKKAGPWERFRIEPKRR